MCLNGRMCGCLLLLICVWMFVMLMVCLLCWLICRLVVSVFMCSRLCFGCSSN